MDESHGLPVINKTVIFRRKLSVENGREEKNEKLRQIITIYVQGKSVTPPLRSHMFFAEVEIQSVPGQQLMGHLKNERAFFRAKNLIESGQRKKEFLSLHHFAECYATIINGSLDLVAVYYGEQGFSQIPAIHIAAKPLLFPPATAKRLASHCDKASFCHKMLEK